jgi:hypothetical protein
MVPEALVRERRTYIAHQPLERTPAMFELVRLGSGASPPAALTESYAKQMIEARFGEGNRRI